VLLGNTICYKRDRHTLFKHYQPFFFVTVAVHLVYVYVFVEYFVVVEYLVEYLVSYFVSVLVTAVVVSAAD
jgi:hypothetical protein